MMTVKIVPTPTFEAAAIKIVEVWRDAGSHQLIRIEGFAGVGKSGLAKLVKEIVKGEHVEGDKFANKHNVPPPYAKCIRQSEFDAAVEYAIATGRVVILDAVCLDEVASIEKWGRGFVVYVKRLSFNNFDPIWHGAFDLEGAPPANEIHRSVHLYHQRAKPHETADLIIELPDFGHSMMNRKFSREMCFDPPGAEVQWSNSK
jgi:hypothetical protein